MLLSKLVGDRKQPLDFQGLKRRIEFEEHIKNAMLINGLKPDVIGILIYLDDGRHYYVGDGVTGPDIAFSRTDWYARFHLCG